MKKSIPSQSLSCQLSQRESLLCKKPLLSGEVAAKQTERWFSLKFCFKVVYLTKEKYICKGILANNFDRTEYNKRVEMKREDVVFYRKLWIIGAPIALQNFMQSSLNMIDVFMVGKLGESAISSVGIANQLFFLLILIMFGINSGASVFTAQFWGKKDLKNIKRTAGIALIFTLIFSNSIF